MNEEIDLDHYVYGDAVEGPVNSGNRSEVV